VTPVPPLFLELFALLLTVGYLRTDQIITVLPVLAAQKQLPLPQKALPRVVQKRLLAFVQAGLLRRLAQPIYPHTRSGPPVYIYTLTKAGAQVAAAHLGVSLSDLAWRESADESQLFLQHTLTTATIRIMLMAACGQEHIALTFVDERLLKRQPAPVTLSGPDGEQVAVSLTPDGFSRLQLPDGKWLAMCWEIDLATATIAPTKWGVRSLRRKWLAYQQLITQGPANDLWDATGAIVVTATTSAPRLTHLREVCEEAGGDHHFWFTTLERLSAATILTAPVWQVAGQGEHGHCLLPG
jgi:hypothetical protein